MSFRGPSGPAATSCLSRPDLAPPRDEVRGRGARIDEATTDMAGREGRTVGFSSAGVGSRSTPLRDINGSVHWLRLKQQAARFPDLSFDSVFSIRIVRVSGFLVDPIQRIQSQRATGVISVHTLRARGSDANALLKSAGIFGSGHSAIDSIAIPTRSPTAALAASSVVPLILNQWLPLPSGSSGA